MSSDPYPCQPDPYLWFSKKADERREAQRACLPCPIRELCDIGAEERQEPHGVWGGVDRSTPSRSRVRPKRCQGCGIWMLPNAGEYASAFARRKYHNQNCAGRTASARKRKAAA